jgi:AcrR family transcriptional regulator
MINIISKTRRQIQKESTRKQILETAIKHFAEYGIITSKTSDIARAATVAHGTIFAHFPNQEALLNAVIEEFGIRVSSRLHELAASNTSLRDILEAHIEGLKEYEAFYTRLVMERRLLPDDARNTFILIQSSISFHISQAAEKEMKAGSIITCPVHLLFNTWAGLVHYYLTNGDLFAPAGLVLERYGEELIDHYMRLITRKS